MAIDRQLPRVRAIGKPNRASVVAIRKSQTAAIARGEAAEKHVYPHQIAFNVIPHIDSFLDNGYTKEEMKMQNEGCKILGLAEFRASVTCVRVPVYRSHSVAVTALFEKPVDVEKARDAIRRAPGVDLDDAPADCRYPMPLDCAGLDNCRVGRIRVDCAFDNALSFWIAGDQLLKGAALNAVQIAELLLD